MNDSKKKVVIVGGVAGGASAAARLRRLDENAEIVMFEKGEFISFANCGLPYYVSGEIKEQSALTLQTPKSFNARFNVDVRILSEVIAINPDVKKVTVKKVVDGTTYEESYDELVLSMGADPIRPNIKGIESNKVFTIRNIPDTLRLKEYVDYKKPQRAVVVGGGFIGLEIAENIKAVGVDVTIVEMSNQVIAPIDYDMAAEVHCHLRSKGVKLMLNSALEEIEEKDNALEVTISGRKVETDMVVMAIGVKPESKMAIEAGIEVNSRGAIKVDSHMRTNIKNIYAIGDVIEITNFITKEKSYVPLAGPANKQGRIVADNICGLGTVYTGTQGSSVMKVFDITVASTGLNEKEAKRQVLDYGKVYTYSANHATYYPGASMMAIKTIYEKKTGKILGAQIVGRDGVDKRCDVYAVAIRANMTAYDLTNLELCYAPPYGSAKDPVNMAGYVIENTLTGKVEHICWEDLEAAKADENGILLDVRTEAEVANAGIIDGFINIPVDNLRARISELDKSKTIYITCQIGLRGYIAARILSQLGYKCKNFSGGYRFYKILEADKNANN
ncbi:CoA-disulfide reductase [Anaeromassilibacillus sp. An172]|uniref:FAD-dependent oxidoreductase n=1 Tax=Anaeromassilibacillus sp. An172 TaxID=1965570 RepID=UPI000B383B1D|nr:FAD-dependent oxidoreductase [Anaeromassilibacillus sp. An172]OUP79567.1 CoA-disulfide reductase [Anaeromassilibacillus sp. An172]